MNDKINIILNIAEEANRNLVNKDLIIPILDNFEVMAEGNERNNNFFVAKYENTLEQFINDGFLKETETFEEHIKQVNLSIKNAVSDNELYKDKNFIMYYKTYETTEFLFKIYLEDILVGTTEHLNFVRQMNAYFVNNQTNEFCQISLATGPYSPSERFKLLDNIQDIDNDELVKILDKSLTVIMNNIRYE